MNRLYPWAIALGMLACRAEGSFQPHPSSPKGAGGSSKLPSGAAPAWILPEETSPVTFAKMAEYPEPGWQVPRAARFAPDGKSVTFLKSEGDTDEMALHATDLASGTTKVLLRASALNADASKSTTQELRDERQRKRIKGITEYQWADKANVLIVPSGADVFLVDGDKVTDLTTTEADAVDPKICADASKVALVRGSELAVIDVASRKETALTKKAPPGVTRGLTDFNGQEEFGEISGHFWSPDCKSILFLEVDEREVAEQAILGHRGGKANLMMQKYPKTGAKNPKVSLFVADTASKKLAAIQLPKEVNAGAYLGRFRFTPDSASVVFWAIDRSQRKADLVVTTLGKAPKSRVVHSVAVKKGWIDMTDVAIAPDGASAFTLLAQAGHLHLAQIDLTKPAPSAPTFLTSGNWDVLAIEGVRKDHKSVLVSATKDDPIGQMLYEVSGPEQIRLLTKEKGVHDISIGPEGKGFIDVWSSLTLPPRAYARVDEATVPLAVPEDADIKALALRTPESFEITAANGDKLHGALLAPRTLEYDRNYPLIVMVYGGPGVQTVRNRWSPRLLWQHLADRGFFVMQVDNRGSSGRGPAFEHAIDRKLGEVELADQLAAVDHIVKTRPIDEHRIGIYGHSYGGFVAALAMLKAPERFRAGVAGSPVTDWRLYDTAYTERFMGTPDENPAGYDASDLEKYAKNLEGDLLIVHSLMDENVHFQSSADLIDALVREKKSFEMFVYPGERHGYRAARHHAMQTVTRFLVRTLGVVDPDAQYE